MKGQIRKGKKKGGITMISMYNVWAGGTGRDVQHREDK